MSVTGAGTGEDASCGAVATVDVGEGLLEHNDVADGVGGRRALRVRREGVHRLCRAINRCVYVEKACTVCVEQ